MSVVCSPPERMAFCNGPNGEQCTDIYPEGVALMFFVLYRWEELGFEGFGVR